MEGVWFPPTLSSVPLVAVGDGLGFVGDVGVGLGVVGDGIGGDTGDGIGGDTGEGRGFVGGEGADESKGS